MPPTLQSPIIEIESSPEPYPHARVRNFGKGKARETSPKIPMGPVIEITDSDSDVEVEFQVRRRKEPTPVAGPSNVQKRRTPPTTGSLFLRSNEDDEDVVMEDVFDPIQTLPVELPQDQVPTQEADPPPAPAPQERVNPVDQTLVKILEVIPDIDPEHALGLVQEHLPAFGALDDDVDAAMWKERTNRAAEHVIGLIFEAGAYPKANKNKKGKARAAEEPERENKRAKIDYASVERVFTGGKNYFELALIHLQTSFRHIPKAHLRCMLLEHNSFYVPTHLAIADNEKRVKDEMSLLPPANAADSFDLARRFGYFAKTTLYNPTKDRKKKLTDEVFDEEKRWLEEYWEDGGGEGAVNKIDKGKGKAVEEEEEIEDGTGIECQCCFAEYSFDKMVQCPEAHLFCSTCISTYASTKLSEHDASLTCMHSSSCPLPFPESELRRVLDEKLMSLYERVVQQKEVAEAGLEGLEECPWCEWKCVMEVGAEVDRLFRCGNEEGGCGVVSCRFCWKKDHLPKSCKEVEEDKKLDGRHAIEEAMTAALMRNCPKCKKAFIKEAGCNKMTCMNCRTLSCYVCRQVITGYDHFDQTPAGRPSTSKDGAKKCLLWDKVEERHAADVKAAADKALADYKELHPDVAEDDLKVDLPVAPPAPPGAAPFPGGMPAIMPGIAGAVGLGGAAAGAAANWAAGWGHRGLPGAAIGGAWGAVAGWGAQAGGGGVGGAAAQVNNAYAAAQAAFYNGQMPAPPGPVPAPVPQPPRPKRRRQAAKDPRPKRAHPAANHMGNIDNAQAGPANQQVPIPVGVGAPVVAAPPGRVTRAARAALINPLPVAANPVNPFAAVPPPRKAARPADRQANMDQARVAFERHRAAQRMQEEAQRIAANPRVELAADLRQRFWEDQERIMAGGNGGGKRRKGPAAR